MALAISPLPVPVSPVIMIVVLLFATFSTILKIFLIGSLWPMILSNICFFSHSIRRLVHHDNLLSISQNVVFTLTDDVTSCVLRLVNRKGTFFITRNAKPVPWNIDPAILFIHCSERAPYFGLCFEKHVVL